MRSNRIMDIAGVVSLGCTGSLEAMNGFNFK